MHYGIELTILRRTTRHFNTSLQTAADPKTNADDFSEKGELQQIEWGDFPPVANRNRHVTIGQ
jgi:hypothetical protein